MTERKRVKAEHIPILWSMKGERIFPVIVKLYGEKLAKELAEELLNNPRIPHSDWQWPLSR